jgi:5-methylcytosine-specific restriction endonuclease McrBC regulatory subunit McrC
LPIDFRGLHYGGLLRPYREPHQWASLVLRLLGPDPLNDIEADERARDLPPFAIDMKELFERYCEVALRNSHEDVWAGYKWIQGDKDRNLGTAFSVRPDFLVKASDGAWIVDAKYKENWDWGRKEHRPDVFQIVTYSRHKEVLKQLELNPDHEQRPNAAIVYPGPSENHRAEPRLSLRTPENRGDILDDFQVAVIRIPLPLPKNEPHRSG